ncbi:hypothetical protein [Stratiformator vulcanicus]|uniref:Uncharacterized protein n=1 Tax=Stratiformator vulcanicus TaxID=2527980 RepID=A0A517R3F4_9PLAN|nr:hypothetical protein [Stratiformator vulcanicus]QDT38404.1 hypothetical protein Pan189_27970 [Stratiformator vulcanicus]
MQVVLSEFHEDEECVWCQKERECVVATFSDEFLKDAPLCWKCLQTAFRVRSSQAESADPESR